MVESSRSLRRLSMFVFSILVSGAALAQGAAREETPVPDLTEVEAALDRVEARLSEVERSRRITAETDPEPALDAYLEALQEAYGKLLEEAERAESGPGGAREVARILQAWEDLAQDHQGRAEEIFRRLTEMTVALRDGGILLAPELLRSFSEEELEDLRRWLTPEAIRAYQELDERLFAAGPAPDAEARTAWSLATAVPEGCALCRDGMERAQAGKPGLLGSALLGLLDWTAPDSDAAVAAGCVAVCSAQPEACIVCVGIAIGAGSQLVEKLEEALADCNRLRRVLRALCKAAVIAGFIAVIA